MNTYRAITFLIVFLIVTTLMKGSSFAQDTLTTVPQSDPTEVMTLGLSDEDIITSQSMWTREAMRNAKPISAPPLDVQAEARLIVREGPGFVGLSSSDRPQAAVIKLARQEFAEEWALLASSDEDVVALVPDQIEATAAPEGTASVFDSYQINSSDFPYSAIGKLFFQTPSGGSSCTATVIGRGNAIVTAAHCVYDTQNNRWYSNWSFAPSYRNGARPYGTFPGTQAWVLNGWIDATGTVRQYDVAIIRLGNNSSGRSITEYTGWLGRSWGYSSVQHHFAFGYPRNLGNGEYLQTCAAESYADGTDVLAMGCDMTYGSSGGPWIRVFKPYAGASSTNYVNSVVSGGTPPTPTFQGPRFTSNNIVPLCNAASCDETLPAAPSNLTASATSSSQINLTWRDNATNETGFKIERKTGSGGSWSQIATVTANATSYQNTGLSANTTYYYRVRANNAAGNSGYSNEANATTQSAVRNLALNRPAWATSQESSTYAPTKGNDGSTSTRWSSRQSSTLGDEWWRVDLGGQTYDRVRIRWEAAYAASHFVGWSTDGTNFSGYWYSISSAGVYGYQIGSRNARYVAVLMRTRAPRMNNYSFYEFEVYNGTWPTAVIDRFEESEAIDAAPILELSPESDAVSELMPAIKPEEPTTTP